MYATDIATGESAAINLFSILDYQNKVVNKPPEQLKNRVKNANIELQQISFAYSKNPTFYILKNINLKFPSGTTTGLVGFSGSGKSTIISLLMRFYDPQEGRILIDGIDIKDMSLTYLRNLIGLVSQEPVLFSGTVEENIKYSKPDASDLEVKIVMEKAYVDLGLKDQVGLKGSRISGGQKQRVAIARSLLKDPKILLFDEATSALDKLNEELVQEALDHAREGRTCITIAHRLSTIQNCDQIVVLSQGEVIETGSHQELLDQKEVYFSMIRAA